MGEDHGVELEGPGTKYTEGWGIPSPTGYTPFFFSLSIRPRPFEGIEGNKLTRMNRFIACTRDQDVKEPG
jgi:hypothetical protein